MILTFKVDLILSVKCLMYISFTIARKVGEFVCKKRVLIGNVMLNL